MQYFKVKHKSNKSLARTGFLKTDQGLVRTPFFLPIATLGAVKTLTFQDLKQLKAQIILSNTYHLMLRPGESLIAKFGGLHKFMNWGKPILTDSGGFQVFSLSKMRKIEKKGVRFRSPLDGKEYFLTPEKSIKIQKKLAVNILMVLDECAPYPSSREYIEKSVALTTQWAKRSKKYFESSNSSLKSIKNKDKYHPLLFGIIQGGVYEDLRLKSAHEIMDLNFDGYAIGGLAVGEPEKEMYKVLDLLCPLLPENKPRYLMGAGKPEQIVQAVRKGVDMFDCVIPTREARHGRLYLWNNKFVSYPKASDNFLEKKNFYQTINIQNKRFKNDFSPINSLSKISLLQKYSKAYLNHLFSIKEPLSLRLATLNNLEFYLDLMAFIRKLINEKKF